LLTLHRGTLQRLLAAAVPPECVRLGHRLVGLSDESARVRLHFEKGDEVVATVVAADGVPSTARRYVSGNVAPTHSGEIGFRAVIPTEESQGLPNPASVHIWCGPNTHVVYYGLEGGTGKSACSLQAIPTSGLDRVFISRASQALETKP
jgi:2-polyprenyl-6-methoxyphenol hydroxylase-like FAD-dependent oxidoreductase